MVYNHYVPLETLGWTNLFLLKEALSVKFMDHQLLGVLELNKHFFHLVFEHRPVSQSLYDELPILHDFSVLYFSFKFKYWLRIKLLARMLFLIFHCFPLISEMFKLLELKTNLEIIYPYICHQVSFQILIALFIIK